MDRSAVAGRDPDDRRALTTAHGEDELEKGRRCVQLTMRLDHAHGTGVARDDVAARDASVDENGLTHRRTPSLGQRALGALAIALNGVQGLLDRVRGMTREHRVIVGSRRVDEVEVGEAAARIRVQRGHRCVKAAFDNGMIPRGELPVGSSPDYRRDPAPHDGGSTHDADDPALLNAVEKGGESGGRYTRYAACHRCILNDLRVYDPGCLMNTLQPLERGCRAVGGGAARRARREDAHRVVESCHGYGGGVGCSLPLLHCHVSGPADWAALSSPALV